jgi:WD40 repeat protein
MSRDRVAACPLFCLAILAGSGAAAPAADTALATPRRDRSGDPLPAGALARLGTTRWRNPDPCFVAFARDGTLLTAGCSLQRTDLRTGEVLRPLTPAGDWVHAAAASADGRLVALARGRNALSVLAADSGEELRTFAVNGAWVVAVGLRPDGKALAAALRRAQETSVTVWDTSTGQVIASLPCAAQATHSLAFSPDGGTLAMSGGDGSIRLWSYRTDAEPRRLLPANRDVGRPPAVSFSPDGKTLASAGAFGGVHLWDVTTGEERTSLGARSGAVTTLAFSPDGRTLATAHDDRIIRLWDVATGGERQMTGHDAPVRCVAFSPDGETLASVATDGSIRLWSRADARERSVADGHRAAVCSVRFSRDGRTVATSGCDGTVRLWEAATGREIRCLPWPMRAPPIDTTPAGGVATPGRNGEAIAIWDPATGVQVGSLGPGLPPVAALAVASDGAVAAVDADGNVRWWESVSGKATGLSSPVASLPAPCAFSIALSPDGRIAAVGGTNAALELWEVETGRREQLLPPGAGTAAGVGFSCDARLLLTGGAGAPVRLWELATGRERPPPGGLPVSYAFALAPDGRMLAVADRTGRVSLVDVATGDVCRVLKGHRDGVVSLAFSPDGRRLASASRDATVLIWDVEGAIPAGAAEPRLSRGRLEALWADLGSAHGPTAHRAVWTLIQDPKQAVPLLREHTQLMQRSLEGRARATQTYDQADVGVTEDELRVVRALEVLERVRTPDAARVLSDVARAATLPRIRSSARAAESRLGLPGAEPTAVRGRPADRSEYRP